MQTFNDIDEALQEGKVILFPTDTIWGLGCRVDKPEAVSRIYEIKQREKTKPFPILVNSIAMLKEYVMSAHPRIETLLTYHEYPLTVIYPKARNLDSSLTHESGSIAIRLVQDEFCKSLIDKQGVPLVATSANIAGEAFPQNFTEISEEIKSRADIIVDFRQNEKKAAKPSIIASYDPDGNLEFIRT
jgi:L-threonylcarbamoyladenylate synthase